MAKKQAPKQEPVEAFADRLAESAYRMGGSEDALAAKVLAVVPEAQITTKREVYRAWPGRSFWEVRFTVTDQNVTEGISTPKS